MPERGDNKIIGICLPFISFILPLVWDSSIMPFSGMCPAHSVRRNVEIFLFLFSFLFCSFGCSPLCERKSLKIMSCVGSHEQWEEGRLNHFPPLHFSSDFRFKSVKDIAVQHNFRSQWTWTIFEIEGHKIVPFQFPGQEKSLGVKLSAVFNHLTEHVCREILTSSQNIIG